LRDQFPKGKNFSSVNRLKNFFGKECPKSPLPFVIYTRGYKKGLCLSRPPSMMARRQSIRRHPTSIEREIFMRQKIWTRLLSVLLMVCMVLSTMTSSLAVESSQSAASNSVVPPLQPTDVTPSSQVILAGNSSQVFSMVLGLRYKYWKIAIQNNSNSPCYITIHKDSPSGEVVYNGNMYTRLAPAHSTKILRNFDPFSEGEYYVVVQSKGGSESLNGILWYKMATTFSESE